MYGFVLFKIVFGTPPTFFMNDPFANSRQTQQPIILHTANFRFIIFQLNYSCKNKSLEVNFPSTAFNFDQYMRVAHVLNIIYYSKMLNLLKHERKFLTEHFTETIIIFGYKFFMCLLWIFRVNLKDKSKNNLGISCWNIFRVIITCKFLKLSLSCLEEKPISHDYGNQALIHYLKTLKVENSLLINFGNLINFVISLSGKFLDECGGECTDCWVQIPFWKKSMLRANSI